MANKIIYDHKGWIDLVFFVILITCFVIATCGDESEAEILLNFRSSLSNDTALDNWNVTVNSTPCKGNVSNWNGVLCNDDGTTFGLKLDQMGLTGIIDMDALTDLKNLRTLSFMYNSFDGPIPEMNKLTSLKVLYLSYNRFSGEIREDAFGSMNSLKILHLARNQFLGEIPKSVVELPTLTELNLEGNQFRGKIPNFPQKGLTMVNLANNQFEGRIPASLSNMNPNYFSGNKDLCGKPLLPCKSSNKRTIVIIAIVVGAVLALVAIAAFLYFRKGRAQTPNLKKTQNTKALKKFSNNMGQKEAQSPNLKRGENGKLQFIRNDREKFELQDLLRASAEVMGSGSFGSCYKAVLLNGYAVVVKRFTQMNSVGKEEFHEHMRRIGRFSHPNLLPLVAFYYRKEEKLLVSDFVQNCSLANLLHARRAPGQPGLDWPIRLKIIRGVARGLAYLYEELPTLTLPHGHLKSSNVLLDHNFEPILTDYALLPVMNEEHAQQLMVAYKSPEFIKHDRTTRKTDVWSLGILILEMLTGKFPANYIRQGKGANADLATWVNSVVREEWTGEVFDKDMKGTKSGEGEMLKLLKIGMCCCEWNVERRWELREAVEKIEELKERGTDIDDYSSYASEGEFYSSTAMTEDEFSFSLNA